MLSIKRFFLLAFVVTQIVRKTDDYERYIVIAVLSSVFKSKTFINYTLGNLTQLQTFCTQCKYTLNNILLRVAIVETITRED